MLGGHSGVKVLKVVSVGQTAGRKENKERSLRRREKSEADKDMKKITDKKKGQEKEERK